MSVLIRVRARQEDTEFFFAPQDLDLAKDCLQVTRETIHYKYCILLTEPTGPCMCTDTYGQYNCKMHQYISEVREHDIKGCPLRLEVVMESISACDGVQPIPE